MIRAMGQRAREASFALAAADSGIRAAALRAMARRLREGAQALIRENSGDLEKAREAGLSPAFIDRLTLTPQRVEQMAQGLEDSAALPDPLGGAKEEWQRPNGLTIQRVRVPLGVIGIIYESRPNVTADAAALCVMSGNAVILRGGSESLASNLAIGEILRGALEEVGLPKDAVQVVPDPSREAATELMGLTGLIDVLIPRGGAGLIRAVLEQAKVPVIETGAGVCHTYVDVACENFELALRVVENAKCNRPSVCNAMETLLVHEKIAEEFLSQCLPMLREQGVEIRGCETTLRIVPWALEAAEQDWAQEYNDMILSVRVVPSLEEAMAHIERYGTRNSECILTDDASRAQRFLQGVDAAAVYHNVSTRFTDGYEFGFGAEIGISNQKLHARGPMGLEQLTSYKYVVRGQGQTRA